MTTQAIHIVAFTMVFAIYCIPLSAEVSDVSGIENTQTTRSSDINAERRCFTIGPFVDPVDRDVAVTRLQEIGLQTIKSRQGKQLVDLYWVAYEGKDHFDAKETYKELKVKGLRDISIITKKPARRFVSLGLFRVAENAGRRMKEIRQFGYNVKIRKVNASATTFWIDAEEQLGAPIAETLWSDLLAIFPNTTRSSVTCEHRNSVTPPSPPF